MTTFETIRLDIDAAGVARLTLARADVHNALNPTMFAEIDQALDLIEANPAVRVVVLSGDGENFCAGGDFRWQQSQGDQDRASRIRSGVPLAKILARLDTFGRPIIGRIEQPHIELDMRAVIFGQLVANRRDVVEGGDRGRHVDGRHKPQAAAADR